MTDKEKLDAIDYVVMHAATEVEALIRIRAILAKSTTDVAWSDQDKDETYIKLDTDHVYVLPRGDQWRIEIYDYSDRLVLKADAHEASPAVLQRCAVALQRALRSKK